jgi:chemotaxis signal transduction protein
MDSQYREDAIGVSVRNLRHGSGGRLGELQAFQARITEKIANAQTSKNITQSFLGLLIGRYNVYLPLRDMSTLIEMPGLVTIPLAKRWLKGLAVVGAEVITVLDLAYCLDYFLSIHFEKNIPDWLTIASASSQFQDVTQKTQSKLLMISPSLQSQLAVSVDKVFGIVSQDTLTTHENNSALDGQVVRQALMNDKGQVFLELSLLDLLNSNAFLNLRY